MKTVGMESVANTSHDIGQATHITSINHLRMTLWVFVSILAHLALIWGASFAVPSYRHPALLQVTLHTVVTETREPLAVAGKTAEFDLPLPAQDAGQPDIAPLNAQHAENTPKLLNLPMDIYYLSSEVDTRAEPTNEVDLVYPLVPYQQRIHGTVRVDIFVNEAGGVDKIMVVDSQPPGVFDEAALKAISELRFSPAMKNGLPVKNRKTVEVTFNPYEKINTP